MQKKSKAFTDGSFWIFAAIATIAGLLCFLKGKTVFLKGLHTSFEMLLNVSPRLVAAFFLAGFAQILSPKNMITKWLGQQSGLKGIIIATLGGIITPGGPMISFPLISALYKLGADAGPIVAYLTSWAILGTQRIIVWEIPFMGIRFALLRFVVSLSLPVIAGFTARKIAGHFNFNFEIRDLP